MTKAIEDRWSKHYGIGEDPNLIPDKPDEGPESYLLSRCMLYCKDNLLPAFHDYSIYMLAIRVWLRGENWKAAKRYAEHIVRGWK